MVGRAHPAADPGLLAAPRAPVAERLTAPQHSRSVPITRQPSTSVLTSFLSRRAPRLAAEEKGVSLVETVLAVGILGLALTAALNAFSALGLSAGHLDRATAADAVANSVGESILNQAYVNYPGTYSTVTDVANPRTYSIAVQIEYASNPAAVTLTTPPTWTTTPVSDYGLQRITITVTPTQGGGARGTRVLKRR